MLPIPEDILKPFDAIMGTKAIPNPLRADYRKWLMYYLDFRFKYPPPDLRSEQVRLFIEKLRSKNQPQKKLEQAAHALSLFFATQPRKKQAVTSVADIMAAAISLPVKLPKGAAHTKSPVVNEKLPAKKPILTPTSLSHR